VNVKFEENAERFHRNQVEKLEMEINHTKVNVEQCCRVSGNPISCGTHGTQEEFCYNEGCFLTQVQLMTTSSHEKKQIIPSFPNSKAQT